MPTPLTAKSTEADKLSSESIVAGREPVARDAHGISALSRLLACPACASSDVSLSTRRDAISCAQCSLQFPIFQCGSAEIPWLFSDPDTTRLEWKARYHGFLQANSLELERLRKARSDSRCSKVGRKRILRLLQAREQHRVQLNDILAPLQLDSIDWPSDAAGLLHGKLPKSLGMSSYVSNIFRDWAWENGENEVLLALVGKALAAASRPELGSVLTLGAGACRLPYDVHQHYSPDLSVVLDFNPLLLRIGSQVIHGEPVSLFEFPVAPLDAASCAVLQECNAPPTTRIDNLHFVLADAMNPPFIDGGFDTVITPWLIDIIPQDLRTFIPRINRCLSEGGVWVNSGSLAFFHEDESWRYSEEELLELIENNGFEILTAERDSVPYLQSPHSAYGRTEKVLSFSARKIGSADVPPSPAYLPNWILDTSLPVPSTTETAIGASNHLLKAQVLATVDGKRTIKKIVRVLARQYGLGIRETTHAVKRILIDAWEHSGADGSHDDL